MPRTASALRFALALVAAIACARAANADQVSDVFGSLSYREIGPAISGGRTSAVAGSDADPRIYYAGGAAGGVFKSEDGGASWHATFDSQPVAPIGALAVEARDANDVWAGTGEPFPRNTVEEGAGIWHSRNGGKSWQFAGLAESRAIAAISIDPRDPQTVAVAVLGHIFRDSRARGVYVTRDGGRTWKQTLYVGPSSGASDIARLPGHPATLFAGIWQFRRQPWNFTSAGPLGGLYRSDDNGATWRKLAGHGLPPGLTGRVGLAAGSGGRVYAIVQSQTAALWRSDDGGDSWRAMPHDPMIGARPFYFSRLTVDPANRNRVISASLVLGLSSDGARTFHAIAKNAGWDYHVTWWSKDGRRIIDGSDEGVVISANGGTNFWQPYDLPFAQPYHVAFGGPLPSYRLCAGLQDNNSWCGLSNADNGIGVLNRDWFIAGPGDGMHALFDPRDENFIWSTAVNSDSGQVYVYDAHTQQTREVSPSARFTQDAPAHLPYRFNWDMPIAFAFDSSALVGGNVVFQSSDRGAHWAVISPDLTRNDPSRQGFSGGPIGQDLSGAETYDTILTLATKHSQPGTIWAGSDDGLLHVTRDAGKVWKNVTPPGVPPWSRVAGIELSPSYASVAYIAVDNHFNGDERPYLFATNDGGTTWSSISGDLPRDQFARTVREDPVNPNLLYAGTQRGVWVTFDRGNHWHSLRLNMPAAPVYDLQVQPQRNDLVVASHGRGMWILDDLGALQRWGAVGSQALHLFQPADAYRMWQAAPVNAFTDGTLPDNEYVGTNRDFGAIVTYYLARAARKVAIDVADAQGHVVKHLSGKSVSGHAGMNRTAWDLTEDGPERWKGTYEQNRGPKNGPEVVPGTYTVRVVADGNTSSQPAVVHGDPRDPAGASEYAARHAFLVQLNAEIGGVDAMLNALDARLPHANAPQAAALRALRSDLTYDPQNIEDLRGPPGLRERLLGLLSRVTSTSFQAPTAVQSEEGARLRASYDALSARYAGLK
jgi:photosystem II stability/assembly factor-like uncharacterized protein